MDEWELEEYLAAIDEIERRVLKNEDLVEQIRDEDGIRVPGCFFVRPAPTEQ
jgi:hypothetical protein